MRFRLGERYCQESDTGLRYRQHAGLGSSIPVMTKNSSSTDSLRTARTGRRPAWRDGGNDSRVTGTVLSANLLGMLAILEAVVGALLAALRPQAILVAENLVLRQQLAILRRATPRPRLQPIDRAFWILVSRTVPKLDRCGRRRVVMDLAQNA